MKKALLIGSFAILLTVGLAAQTIFSSTTTGSTSTTGANPAATITTTGIGASGLQAALATQGTSIPSADARAVIAMSTADYLVTPGDVYTLNFLKSYQPSSLSIMVEGDGSINVGIFGRIQASGMTFVSLKALLEKKVSDSYPGSSPSLIIASTGLYTIKVKGEVSKSDIVTVWGLSRLSGAFLDIRTPYSSMRDVQVTSSDGSVKAYDLYKASRRGDLSQDPYLRPGDVVEVKRAERIVSVSGEVRRPGTYQLMAGEGIAELLASYGDGLLESAKTDLVVVTKRATKETPEGQSVVVDLSAKALPQLVDGDSVRVPSREEYLPVVYVEGALVTEQAKAVTATGTTVVADLYGMVRVPYRKGELLSQVVKPQAGKLSQKADLRNAYIMRGSERVGVNLEKLLYAYDVKDDVVLQAEDRVVIPFGQDYAYIKGEVTAASWVAVTGDTRLSAALSGKLTGLASTRDIRVTGLDGAVNTYDLFKAERVGDVSQDPYLRPGDVVEVKKAERIVSVSGEVRRPGTYQLMAGEGIAELLASYGDGLLESAKTDLVVVTKRATKETPEGQSVVVDLSAKALPQLVDGDSVRVPSREEYLPVVYVEGALVTEQAVAQPTVAGQGAAQVVPEAYGLVRVPYRKGELLSQVVKPQAGKLSQKADLRNAYIMRGSERVGVNLEKLLYAYDVKDDVVLQAEDRVVIPFGQDYAYIKGEVTAASWVAVTGDTRLSAALSGKLTGLASTRDIRVTGLDGAVNTYDLFKAERVGDVSQDPYLRPGDVVEVKRAERIVSVSGEVRRPGTYQLMAGEGIAELLASYGDGLLESAKTDLVVVTKRATKETPEGQSVVVDLSAKALPQLVDGDSVRVPSREEYLPVVYVEGALVTEQAKAVTATGTTVVADLYGMVRVPYRKGELLSQVVKPQAGKLSQKADLRNAYIMRGSERVGVNLEKLLYAYDVKDDVVLQAEDRVVIPFGQDYAYIKGEVTAASWVAVTGDTRLSAALSGKLTGLASTRDIRVTGLDGAVNTYDLFKASRRGDLSQDPYLRPGDVVEVKRAERIVSVSGEVRRPGTYQLMAGEGIAELLASYGDGLLESAKTDLVVVTKRATKETPEGQSVVVDLSAKALPQLVDGDSVRVPSREEYLPVVYVEGALVTEQAKAVTATGTTVVADLYGMVRVPYRKGELLSQVVKPQAGKLSQKADLRNAYIMRGSERVGVNLEKLLYAYDVKDDVVLQAEDRVVIPFGQDYAYIKGEVTAASWVAVTGDTRLSAALSGKLTGLASTRDIRVTGLDGAVNTYDLFKASRRGDLSQDPYLRPGDVVEVKRAERIVSVSGEVRRPGTYQLMAGEGIAELLASYGDGLLESAKTDLVVVTKRATKETPEGQSVVVDLSAKALPQLVDGDSVRVPSREEYLPVVYVEGALVTEQAKAVTATGTTVVADLYGMVRVPYRKGELLSQVVKPQAGKLSQKADLRNAYIMRGSERVGVNLEKLLYAYDVKDDVVLQAEDRVVIPFGQDYAYIKGEVTAASWVAVTGDTRLSAALSGKLTGLASTRDIRVTGLDGAVNTYDLFKAERVGDVSQDPYLRPGDVVEVKRAERIVSVSGEVRRPGTYQLMAGEGIAELLASYGDGLLESAKTDLVVVTKRATKETPEGQSVVVDLSAKALPQLVDGDSVRVPSREEYLPVVYVEGAVGGEPIALVNQDQKAIQNSNYSLLRLPYRDGILLSQLLKPIRDKIYPSANLKKAFIIRKGSSDQIPIDLEKLLYFYENKNDVVLYPEDRIIIPFGSMYVFVSGEVAKSSWISITGLTRLREVVQPLVTRYSSLRDVIVKGEDGSEKQYDLFKAERYGDLSQDPFLRPGEEVIVKAFTKLITIQGEVKRPGTYQLLPGEGLKDLIDRYADGFSEKANPTRMNIIRYVSETSQVGEKIQFDYTKTPNLPITGYDVISVPPYQDLLPVVWLEGAVGVGVAGASPETSQRIPYTFFPGDTVSQAALANRKLFSAVSDISNAYILRDGGKILKADLAKFIYNQDTTGDIPLMPNDIIMVPFRQFFVSVSGAVKSPGRYPYIPDRSWEYYIGLAGGFDTDKNSGQKISILDINSKLASQNGRYIQPEDNIVADSNSLIYGFFRISSILTTIISVVSLVITLIRYPLF